MDDATKYDLMVVRGKKLIGEIKCLDKKIYAHQLDIAKMAIAVCSIRHGGISNDLYTIKNYAKDIDLAVKTVQNWVQVYKNVVLKLEKKISTPKDWANASKTNNLLKEQRRNENQINSRQKSRDAYKKDIPKEKVRDIFKSITDGKGLQTHDFIKSSKSAKHIKYVVSKIDLGMINERDLTCLMETLDETSDMINDHLTARARRTA